MYACVYSPLYACVGVNITSKVPQHDAVSRIPPLPLIPASVDTAVKLSIYTAHDVQCTVYSVQCTVYNVQCTVYNVQYTVYSVQCTVYSVHDRRFDRRFDRRLQCIVVSVYAVYLQIVSHDAALYYTSITRVCIQVHIQYKYIYTYITNIVCRYYFIY